MTEQTSNFKKLAEVIDEATPERWEARLTAPGGIFFERDDGVEIQVADMGNCFNPSIRADARAIAALHNSAPELLAVVEAVGRYRVSRLNEAGAAIAEQEMYEALAALEAKLRTIVSDT